MILAVRNMTLFFLTSTCLRRRRGQLGGSFECSSTIEKIRNRESRTSHFLSMRHYCYFSANISTQMLMITSFLAPRWVRKTQCPTFCTLAVQPWTTDIWSWKRFLHYIIKNVSGEILIPSFIKHRFYPIWSKQLIQDEIIPRSPIIGQWT